MVLTILFVVGMSGALAGNSAFDDGVKLYRTLEYEQAVFRFQEVALTPDLSPQDRGLAFVWLGLAYAGSGDFEAAKRSFRDALRADPATALPPDTPPRVAELFDEVKRELAPPVSDNTASATTNVGATTTTPPVQEPAAAPSSFPWSVVALGGGAVALGGAAVCATVSADAFAKASDPDAFQDDVVDALATTNAALIGAIGLGVIGTGLVVTGGALLIAE